MKHIIAVLALLFMTGVSAEENPLVLVQTNHGDFKLELYPAQAPQTVENFLRYAREGFYNGTIFHRVVADYMVQGGGYTDSYQRKTTYEPIPLESNNGLKNELGTLSMARMSSPNSATSQFFINLKHNPELDYQDKTREGWGYTVFGRVVEGMETVNAIAATKTGAAGPFRKHAPHDPVVVRKILIERGVSKAAHATQVVGSLGATADDADVGEDDTATDDEYTDEDDTAADDEYTDEDDAAAEDDEYLDAEDDTAADDEAEAQSAAKPAAAAAKPVAAKPATVKPAAVKPVAANVPEPPDVPAVE